MIKKILKDASLKDRYKISKPEMLAIVKDIINGVKSRWLGKPKIQKQEFMKILEAKDVKTFRDIIKKFDGGMGIVADMYDNEEQVMKLFKKVAQFGRAKPFRQSKAKNDFVMKPSEDPKESPRKSGDSMLDAIIMMPFISNMISTGFED